MLENVGRKVTFTVLFLAVSVICLIFSDPPFTLGLDIQGGTRLVYSVDIDQAREDKTVDPNESNAQILEEMLQIIRTRVDPQGVREPIIRSIGDNQIVIELPGTLGVPSKEASSTTTGALAPFVMNEVLGIADVSEFPESGAVEIDGERIKYDGKVADGIRITTRDDPNASHAAGAVVNLVGDDAFKSAIESLGDLSFQIVAVASQMPDDTDMETERSKLDTWAEAHPGSPLRSFNALPSADGGPNEKFEWFPWDPTLPQNIDKPEAQRAELIEVPIDASETFRGNALKTVSRSQDDLGFPAVGFEIMPERVSDFGDFTEKNEGRQMAIILNGEIRSAPSLEDRLSTGGRIFGRFSEDEVTALVTVLRSGSLKIKPTLESDERVGATLGDEYVTRGTYSGILALVSVLGFLIVYYRRLGAIASIALSLNFVMLLGALSFAHATITLPGIAGIILTVGMAVDANILIFDRIREEMDKGRNIKQAAKEGFDKAMPAILDANITTFLTAFILFTQGSGPVAGFAVTLMWGIVTSVFAALVITRLLVHLALEKGAKSFAIGQWMVKANYQFMSKTKLALTASLVAVVLGIAGFALEDPGKKYGIDFIGGAEAQLQTAQAETVETVRSRIQAIDVIGDSADVKAVLSSDAGDGKYTSFRATFKLTDGNQNLGKDASRVRGLLRDGLEGLLLEDAVQVAITDETTTAKANVTLLFQEPHPTDDIVNMLATIGLNEAQVATGGDANQYTATATTAFGRRAGDVSSDLETAFTGASDSNGADYRLATGIPSYSQVSPQVVGNLRSSALLAMLISMLVIVLYIRVRFAEYSYGFAAMAAVVHDVFIALGVLTLANKIGFLNGEINLPMIAAFLTIMGYSLNDTIVIFDRVRENLPRMKKPFNEVLDASINQTLSRTILTSFTTFLAVALLYAFNFGTGNVLESFSFAMMIGVLTGTYSTIFVANPLLLWFEKRAGRIDSAGQVIPSDETTKASSKSGKQEIETAHV